MREEKKEKYISKINLDGTYYSMFVCVCVRTHIPWMV